MKNTFRVKCSEKGRSFSSLIQINSNVFPSPFSVRDFFICSLDSRPRIQREAFSSVSIQLARSFLASSRERGKYYRPEKCEISSSLARSRGTKQARAERSLPLRVAHSHLRPNKQTQAQREDIFSSRSARSLVRSRQSGASDRKGLAAPRPGGAREAPPESSARVSASSSAFAREDGAALRPPQPVGVEDGRRGQDRQEESVGAGVGGPRREAERTTPPGVGVEGPPDDDPGTSLRPCNGG